MNLARSPQRAVSSLSSHEYDPVKIVNSVIDTSQMEGKEAKSQVLNPQMRHQGHSGIMHILLRNPETVGISQMPNEPNTSGRKIEMVNGQTIGVVMGLESQGMNLGGLKTVMLTQICISAITNLEWNPSLGKLTHGPKRV